MPLNTVRMQLKTCRTRSDTHPMLLNAWRMLFVARRMVLKAFARDVAAGSTSLTP